MTNRAPGNFSRRRSKVKVADLALGNALVSLPELADQVPFHNLSGPNTRVSSFAEVLKLVALYPALTTVALDDRVTVRDTSAAGLLSDVAVSAILAAGGGLIPLSADTTFFYRTDGLDDANRTGLVDSATEAWATPGFAYSTIRQRYHGNNKNVIIAAGGAGARTFSHASLIVQLTAPIIGALSITFRGEIANPTNVRWDTTGASGVVFQHGCVAPICPIILDGIRLSASGQAGGIGIRHRGNGALLLGNVYILNCPENLIEHSAFNSHIEILGSKTLEIETTAVGCNIGFLLDTDGLLQTGNISFVGNNVFGDFIDLRFDAHAFLGGTGTILGTGTFFTGRPYRMRDNTRLRLNDNLLTTKGTVAAAVEPGCFVSVGGTTDKTTARQIEFPASQVPSANANTLDDYEEGTFPAQLTFGGNSVGMSGTFVGTYTKIGNRVYFDAKFTLSAKGSSTGSATITGLPFAQVSPGGGAPFLDAVSIGAGLCPQWDVNGTSIRLRTIMQASPGTNGAMGEAVFANNSSVAIHGHYFTS